MIEVVFYLLQQGISVNNKIEWKYLKGEDFTDLAVANGRKNSLVKLCPEYSYRLIKCEGDDEFNCEVLDD